MSIIIKTQEEIEGIRKSCHLLRNLFEELDSYIKEGQSTLDVDRFCYDFIIKHKGKPAFLNYSGFPNSACISVNEEVIHGIPNSKRILHEGDLVSVDLGINLDGFISDSTHSYEIGKVSQRVHKINEDTRKSLYLAIDAINNTKGKTRINDISRAVYDFCKSLGYGVIRDYCGHGVGLHVHEDPLIPNYVATEGNLRLKPGMVIAVEPMISLGTWRVKVLSNKWTVVTLDKSVACHWEHTLAILEDGSCEILT